MDDKNLQQNLSSELRTEYVCTQLQQETFTEVTHLYFTFVKSNVR